MEKEFDLYELYRYEEQKKLKLMQEENDDYYGDFYLCLNSNTNSIDLIYAIGERVNNSVVVRTKPDFILRFYKEGDTVCVEKCEDLTAYLRKNLVWANDMIQGFDDCIYRKNQIEINALFNRIFALSNVSQFKSAYEHNVELNNKIFERTTGLSYARDELNQKLSSTNKELKELDEYYTNDKKNIKL